MGTRMGTTIPLKDLDSSADAVIFGDLRYFAHVADGRKAVIVTEPKVRSLYPEAFSSLPCVEVPEGENAKSMEWLGALYKKFASLELDRHSCVLAVGGGSVSDLAGFAAHTWMRGVDFFVAPTTLLSMTDAALGGKNGIDFGGMKNLVGSFHLPRAVYCDSRTLYSLDPTQFASGMAEVVKHAIIAGEASFEFLESVVSGSSPFVHRSIDAETLKKMVADSQRVKIDIVSRDFRELGARKLLNLGHTVGHAVESITGMPHGFCVSLGIAAACGISVEKGAMAVGTLERIVGLLNDLRLPTSLPSLGASVLREIPRKILGDKKRSADKIDFVLPVALGQVEVVPLEIELLVGLLGGL